MSQIYIIFIELMENGDNYDIFMKKKRKKKNEDTLLWDTDIFIYHLYHFYLSSGWTFFMNAKHESLEFVG